MFKVEARFVDGFSLTGVQVRLLQRLGCQPDQSCRVEIAAPSNCRPLSVNWPLSSPTGPTIGFLADPVSALGAEAVTGFALCFSGEGVRIEATPQYNALPHSEETAESIASRMKQRRQLL